MNIFLAILLAASVYAEVDTVYPGSEKYYRSTQSALVSTNPMRVGGYTSDDREALVWFDSIKVPQGNIIDSAFFYRYAYENNTSSDPTVSVVCEDTNSATVATDSSDYRAKSITSNSASWTIPTETVSSLYKSDDIKSPLQEVVDRVGYTSTSAVYIFFQESSFPATSKRSWIRRDFNGSDPYLVIYHHEPSTTKNWQIRK